MNAPAPAPLSLAAEREAFIKTQLAGLEREMRRLGWKPGMGRRGLPSATDENEYVAESLADQAHDNAKQYRGN